MKISPEVEKIGQKEAGVMVDLAENTRETVPREVKTWMEKVESDPVATGISDQNGQPLLTPSDGGTPVIQLPLSRKTFVAGFKKKMNEAGRWLTEFVFRVIKIHKGRVKFREK
ncbi:MAG: hypothetical protein WCV93_05375 [Candidatus Shapirobacteria bacterium]